MGEESKFVKLLGNSPMIKVLDFLLTYREFEYSKTEMAENSEISYNTFKSILPYLNNAVIIKTRRIRNQDMFKLNSDNKYVKDVIRLFDSLVKHSIDEAKKYS